MVTLVESQRANTSAFTATVPWHVLFMQARTEPEKKKRFINDTIRSDFHRSFLKKYVR
jgi:Cwf15/Cwc15 cell cycle control protein